MKEKGPDIRAFFYGIITNLRERTAHHKPGDPFFPVAVMPQGITRNH